ncbi:hypothetical protein M5689_008121 [Euphorbia peplus]|nr:hypothetical protein M5689_008121 [Euphorbia peplus]
MVHLPIHLANQAKLAGPVSYRWMFSSEREMLKYKRYVRNKARPEGSIAEGYIADECLTFCSRYLERAETRFNRKERNCAGVEVKNIGLSIFSSYGKPLSKGTSKELNYADWKRAQLYVLRNCNEVQPFLELYETRNANDDPDFIKWFEKTVTSLKKGGDKSICKDLLVLAEAPLKRVNSFAGFVVNGYRFHTKKHSENRKTQNCGVYVKGDVVSGEKEYFGLLNDIIELEYSGDRKIVLFHCDWYDVYDAQRGIKRDQNGIIAVNVSKFLQTDEPFVLANQVQQVYYVDDQLNPNWQLVVKTMPRNLYDAPICDDKDDDIEVYGDTRLYFGEKLEYTVIDNDVTMSLVRNDVSPELVAEIDTHTKGSRSSTGIGYFIEEDDDDINTWLTSDEEDMSDVEERDEESVEDDDDSE